MKVSDLLVVHIVSVLTVVSGQCLFPKHTLRPDQLAAYKKIKPLIGKRFTAIDVINMYQYSVGICMDADAAMSPDLKGVGVLQTKITDDKFTPISVGKYTETTIMAGPNWVMLEYGKGKPYAAHHCNGGARKAIIMINCDPAATDSNPGMLVLEENTNMTTDCYYLFQLDHKEVCSQSTSSVLSLGSIFIIVFFTVVAVYLLVGALYQRFVLGAKGMEQIPNYSFWQDFGNLEADGCNFLCRSGDGDKGQRRYHGIGDDQLEQPEERDDNLLPM